MTLTITTYLAGNNTTTGQIGAFTATVIVSVALML